MSTSASACLTISRSSRALSKHTTGSQALQTYFDELAQEATRDKSVDSIEEPELSRIPVGALVCASLCVMGMLRWHSERRPWLPLAYQWLARAGVVLAAAAFFLEALWDVAGRTSPGEGLLASCDADACWRHAGFISQLPLPVGALIALLPLGLRRQQLRLEQTLLVVRAVSIDRGYRDREVSHHRRDMAAFVAMWLGIVAAAGGSSAGLPTATTAGRMCLTAICSAVIFCLSYIIVFLCRSLIVMVDAFSCDVVDMVPLDRVAHTWNLTQAVLRKASIDVEKCLLGLCIILAISVPLLVVDLALLGARSASPLPALLVLCGVIYALLVAAMVSEKCCRIPAFINLICFGPGTERMRQHTVDYIASSAAGFYVFDTRLTMSMVVKMTYVWCIVVVGTLTRLAGSEP